jgi:anhydro-N-acetylmuramic acid kinase
VIAFDTGPGNMVIDALAQELFGKPFDRNGALPPGHGACAGAGAALRNPYFQLKPPRTAGREQFGREYAAKFLAGCRRHSKEARRCAGHGDGADRETIARSYKRFVRRR